MNNGETKQNGVAAKARTRKTDNYTRANFVSKVFYCWMLPTFFRGRKKEADLEDLCLSPESDLSQRLADKLERNWFLEEANAKIAGRKPSLGKALFKTFIWSHLLDVFLLSLYMLVFRAFQPTVLAKLLKYWDEENPVPWKSAMWYAALLILMSFLSALVNHHTNRRCQQLGMRIRIACCSLIYRKVTRMSVSSLNEAAAGKVVNLLSNDVSRFDLVVAFFPYILITPFSLILISYLMYNEAGISGLIGVVVIVLQTVPIQMYMSRITSRLRSLVASATDDRVKLMNEVISGIQVIKMYAWESPFEVVVSASRKKEIGFIRKASYVRGIFLSFMVFTERFTLYCTLLAYTLLGKKITAAVVFPLAQFFNILQLSLAIMLPNSISFTAEMMISVKRISDFLQQDEREDLAEVARAQYLKPMNVFNKRSSKKEFADGEVLPQTNGTAFKKIDEVGGAVNLGYDKTENIMNDLGYSERKTVELSHVTAVWNDEGVHPALSDVSLAVGRGQLCAIIGSVGSGKSSLLQLILGELVHRQGEVKVNGQVSYSSQEPWLFVATVRQNILFGQPFDPKKYREVVRVCALEKDFQQFPRGDQTLVGERGVSLSGGQRARINLARAVYRQADVYLLDDPLSAVDAAVGRQLFDNCISGYLQDQTRLLVTHQLHYLKVADIIVILNNGKVENIGTYEELVSTGENFAKLLAALQEDKEEEVVKVGEKSQIRRMSTRRSSSRHESIAPDATIDNNDDAEELDNEERVMGTQSLSLYTKYWTSGSSWYKIIIMLIIMVLGQLSATASDWWVTYWTDEELAHRNDYVVNQATSSSGFTQNQTQYSESSVLDADRKIGLFTSKEYIYIYTGIILSCIVLTIMRSTIFFKLSMNSSKGLHDQMFHSLLRGIMRFFDTNPSGRILNRFSKDIGAVDELLPKAVMEMVQIFLVGASIIVLVSVSNVVLLIPVAIMFVILYFFMTIYLKSAQAIKRIEGVTKSPVFSHLTATLNGITTIRCTQSQQRFITEFDEFQDVHTSAWNLYVTSATTLGFWLDCVVCIFLTVVTYSFLLMDGSLVSSGQCGLAISQSLILAGMLQYGIRQTAEVISQMTSVERVLQYTHIETEKNLDKGGRDVPEHWPTHGAVRMRNAGLRYANDKPPVLIDLNLDIQPGWKVGIVGRTGAGKTSLISALFRLAKIEGQIEIDGIDTSLIALQKLRTKISIIPQEPVLFSASVRYNLDPFNKYDDASLWQALEDIELKDSIPTLDYMVTQGGSNFSLGQRQLICLARAILKKNKILVLDEATANVDPQTDSFIQRTIRVKFAACTVLTIAHRLNTVMDSDRVLVMNFGRAVEFDHPYALLTNKQGYLTSMVKETGPKMTMQLFNIAKETYIKNGGVIGDIDDSLHEE